jgi:hypothetical protein
MKTARVLIKYSTSKCNKDLLDYLIRNISSIKKRYNIRVLKVYKNNFDIIKGKIDRLPALIIDGRVYTGNSNIKKQLSATSRRQKTTTQYDPLDLSNYMASEMSMERKMQDDCDEGDETMKNVEKIAAERTLQRKEHFERRKNKKRSVSIQEPIQQSSRGNNIKTGEISIADMEDDPFMKKMWANQERTPGVI